MTLIQPEILAPAGNLEKMIFALNYGADAVYLGGKSFSLRAAAGNFTMEEIKQGTDIAHSLKKKVYITLNIFAHNSDLANIPQYLELLQQIGVDGLIISDPGIFRLAQKYAPQVPIHISTQANNCNFETANFWHDLGAKRMVLARELSFDEVREIAQKSPLETEIFIHGAMCISYSGRCLLSNFLTNRDSNKGECSHPCRWNYVLEEESRPGEYFPIQEDERGAYILNSKDLCLLPLLPQLMQTGATSWKIEGRNKSAYYVANITRIYRTALDHYLDEQENFHVRTEWLEELAKVSHREYTTAFAVNQPTGDSCRYDSGYYLRGYDFAGIAKNKEDGWLWIEQRNNLKVGDEIEFILPNGTNLNLIINEMKDAGGEKILVAPHPKQMFAIPLEQDIPYGSILRRPVK